MKTVIIAVMVGVFASGAFAQHPESKMDDKKMESKMDDKKMESKMDGKKMESKMDDKKMESKMDGKKMESKMDGKKMESKMDGKKMESKMDGKKMESKMKMKDGIMMVDGKTMVCSKNTCTPLMETYHCEDGSMVSKDGKVTHKDGTFMMLMNGSMISKGGKVSKIEHGETGHVCSDNCPMHGKM